MIVDLSVEDLELINDALNALQETSGQDDGAEELQERVKAWQQAEPQDLSKLQKHLGDYFTFTQPLEHDPNRLVGVRLHRAASAHAAAISTAEALMFCSPLWKLIRQWKK